MMKNNKLRTPIGSYGGKGLLVKKLLRFMPEHKRYGEVFGGGASLLMAKHPAEFEVYNDIDGVLVDFFKVLADPKLFKSFHEYISILPYSRELWKEFKGDWAHEPDLIKRVGKWFLVIRQSINRTGQSWSFNTLKRPVSQSWLSVIELLPQIHRRLQRVQIENLDFRQFFETFISRWKYSDTFVYLDPPYLYETRKRKRVYRFEMNEKDYKDLIELLVKYETNAKFMLSGYDNELYSTLKKRGWYIQGFDTTCFAVVRSRPIKTLGVDGLYRKECIWMNYDLTLNLFNKEFLENEVITKDLNEDE